MSINHIIHGSLRNDESEAASLLLFEVKFLTFKAKTRLRLAEISLQFELLHTYHQNDSNDEAHEHLEICDIAPKDLSILVRTR